MRKLRESDIKHIRVEVRYSSLSVIHSLSNVCSYCLEFVLQGIDSNFSSSWQNFGYELAPAIFSIQFLQAKVFQ